MKFCEKCGNQLNDEAVVCMNCGCAVDSSFANLSNSSSAAVEKAPRGPFSSKKSITATVLGGIGIGLPIVGIFIAWMLGSLSNVIIGLACIVISIIGLIIAIKALRTREPNSDTLALIALFLSIGGIAVSTIVTIIYTIITIIYTVILAIYGGVLGAYVVAILAALGLAM